MAAFSYAALDTRGKEHRGILEAESPRHVRGLLRDKGWAPLRVDPAVENPSGRAQVSTAQNVAANTVALRGPTMKVGELALVTRQLATLLQSAMPLEESLMAVSQQTENARVSSIVSAVRSKVMEGHSLANSLADFPRAFPSLYRATVSAGEHAGHLDLVLQRLADYTEHAYESRQKLRLALIYPVLLFILSVAIVAGLMAFVVPDVVEVFIGQGQALPAITQGLISLSDFIVNYGLWVLAVGVVLLLLWRSALQRSGIRLWWDRRLLSLPLLGRFIRGSNTARYASTLSILTSSGVPLVEAMAIASQVVSNRYLEEEVKQAAQQVREGGSLHLALSQCGYFPPMMIHMIASGEASGELDRMLSRVADSQQRELDTQLAALIGVIEPAMLVFMGAAVLVIVIAILQPIFDMNQLI